MKKTKYFAIDTTYNRVIASGDRIANVKQQAEEAIALTAQMNGWPAEGFGRGNVEAEIVNGAWEN